MKTKRTYVWQTQAKKWCETVTFKKLTILYAIYMKMMGSHTFSDPLNENMSKMKLLRLTKGMSNLRILSVELSSDLLMIG